MSRYSSADGIGSDVHASRVMAPDARDLTPGETSSATGSMAFLYALVSVLAAASLVAPEDRPWNIRRRETLRASNGSYFSPQIALRPPPVL